jgi:hypothetical protein
MPSAGWLRPSPISCATSSWVRLSGCSLDLRADHRGGSSPDRAGNSRAAIALVGALLGFCLPLANTIAIPSADRRRAVVAGGASRSGVVHVADRLLLPAFRRRSKPTRAAAGITAGGFSTASA